MKRPWYKKYFKINENVMMSTDNNAYVVFNRLMDNAGDEKGQWFGSLRELAKLCNMSHNTLYHVLERLENEQMVKREVKRQKSIITICKWATYQSVPETVSETRVKQARNKAETRLKQLTGVENAQNKNKKKNKNTHGDTEQLEPALSEFVAMRKLIKKPMTSNAVSRLVSKLNSLYPDNPIKQQACLLQSVDHNWQSVYELHQEPEKKAGYVF